MNDWLRLPYTLSTWFVAVCYATLLASLVLCPLLLLRRLAGRRLRSLSRMALWYVLLALMLLLPASMHWGTGFTFVGRVGPDYALPPVCFTFRALGRLVSDGGGPFWQPSGALRLHVFASLSPNRGLFVHEMDGMPVLLVWLAGSALSLLLPAAGYLRLRQKLRGADRPGDRLRPGALRARAPGGPGGLPSAVSGALLSLSGRVAAARADPGPGAVGGSYAGGAPQRGRP